MSVSDKFKYHLSDDEIVPETGITDMPGMHACIIISKWFRVSKLITCLLAKKTIPLFSCITPDKPFYTA